MATVDESVAVRRQAPVARRRKGRPVTDCEVAMVAADGAAESERRSGRIESDEGREESSGGVDEWREGRFA